MYRPVELLLYILNIGFRNPFEINFFKDIILLMLKDFFCVVVFVQSFEIRILYFISFLVCYLQVADMPR